MYRVPLLPEQSVSSPLGCIVEPLATLLPGDGNPKKHAIDGFKAQALFAGTTQPAAAVVTDHVAEVVAPTFTDAVTAVEPDETESGSCHPS
jgi:hypothetical protein